MRSFADLFKQLIEAAAEWDKIQNMPTQFPPANHGHSINEISGLQTSLDSKAALASPALTGNPTATTQTAGNNSTRIATTAFVTTAVNNGVSGKADLASPALTGSPTSTTPSSGTNNTRIATTAFVQSELSQLQNSITKGFGSFCSGKPSANQIVGGGVAPYSFTLSAANSECKSIIAATGVTIFVIRKNTTTIGTVTWAAGSTIGVVAYTAPTVAAKDLITLHAPASPDATLSDISFTLVS